MSLKETLKNKIKTEGSLSLDEIYQICRDCGYKQSNAERRLRELTNSGEVAPIYNDSNKYIKGYKRVEKKEQRFLFQPRFLTESEIK